MEADIFDLKRPTEKSSSMVASSSGNENDEDLRDGNMSEPTPPPTGSVAVAAEVTPNGVDTGAGKKEVEYVRGIRLFLIIFALLMGIFLVALDMSIIATAIPKISNEFRSLDEIGWYGSGFFLTLASFISFWAKAYQLLPIKWPFLTAYTIFSLGSLICGLSTVSQMLIAGRVIQGIGGAGMTQGCYTIVALIVPPRKVAVYMGIFGSAFAFSSVAGPLLGGAFTEKVSWRWCFYINVPIAGTAIAILALCFRTPAHSIPPPISIKRTLAMADFPGITALIGSMVALFLALEWGGVSRSWSSAPVLATLVVGSVLTCAVVVIEWFQGERALVPPRLIGKRNMAACCAYTFLFAAFSRVYNIPIYFQAIDGVSPTESGIRVLATILPVSLFTFVGAATVQRIGYYQIYLIIAGTLATIGSGLIYTFYIGTPAPMYIGYQVILGVGVGLAMQVPVIFAQTTAKQEDMAMAMSVALTLYFLGGAYGISVAQNIFANRLLQTLPDLAPDVSPRLILQAGAYSLERVANSPQELLGIRLAYLHGLKGAWIMSIVASGLSAFAGLAADWKPLKRVENSGGSPGGSGEASMEEGERGMESDGDNNAEKGTRSGETAS
ncbi:hypothetical protein AJ80_05846 [Polytolypa hystricis UAMH7299]|uniref:Major facilitator superfamily (MFS) profile domain-containing protein n=1 Tax=Polytolypa hystricis (strain UAMH7299) TaxID=1447883 RepID=A0A2B7Y0E6_POLH7|nr:hypothetical protein AJ80_05846 [Polytolypa hystricis UAMH7299]